MIAEDFSRTRGAIWPETKTLIDKYLSEGENVLDLGCGNGRYFEYLKEKNVNYFGIDSSKKLIALAKKRYLEANFQVADAFNLPFLDNFFDKVISIAVLHHIPSEEFRIQFLKEARRTLKPGGILILTVWDFLGLKEIPVFLKFVILKLLGSKLDFWDFLKPWKEKTIRYFHYFFKKELINLAKKVELEVKEFGSIRDEKGNRRNKILIAQKPL